MKKGLETGMNWFQFPGKWNNGVRFKKADFAESGEMFANPDRGWYQIFPFRIGEPFDEAQIKSCLLPDEPLVLVILDLVNYNREEMPPQALEQIRYILSFFVREKKDMILRGTYDREGKAREKEPTLFSIVKTHLEQLTQIVDEFGEHVFVYQGMLLGSWGEMHTSRYLDDSHMVQLYHVLRTRLGKTYLAFRTPAQLNMLCASIDKNMLVTNAVNRHTGMFDDAFLASETDYGTFLDPEREYEILEELGRQVPMGGEAVYGDGYVKTLSDREIFRAFETLHFTYLNRQHDEKMIDHLKKTGLYDKLGRRLGYRLRVSNATAECQRDRDGNFLLSLCLYIENSGFAPVYRDTVSSLLWETAGGETGEAELEISFRGMLGTTKVKTGPVKIAGADLKLPCKLWLKTARKFDLTPIRFANESPDGQKVWLGELI